MTPSEQRVVMQREPAAVDNTDSVVMGAYDEEANLDTVDERVRVFFPLPSCR